MAEALLLPLLSTVVAGSWREKELLLVPLAKVLTRLLLWSRLSSMVFWLIGQNMIHGKNDFLT